ncbi:uncharacterized protein CANTADRAFT_295462 [Suhomyces tanzawaensis NRRL Y-17324]|uniref:rRNA biogenesis protein RRP5 n=1 Tax=Suhomyces tanzawaensis NRRL Y-17324 TaxID=984487 RepID=A0A1E4SF21_9ASCO|nr:uncharacterized protein CANTADRAFT_295462 [Suhomyces tanzawaensis NRRL Y-17324]ODV78083.1 hypothetical protein CANTADRAFT_295462 [Suhomyces tanzawaensis NRRL Y-17324]
MVDSKSVISSSEVSFPRGGSTALTPLEVKEVSNEVTRDVLFETASASKRSSNFKADQPTKKSRKSKKKATTEEPKEDVVTIDNFSPKNLHADTTVLGQITSINKMDITLCLGDNLFGVVSITSISEEINKLIEEIDQSEEESDEESDDEETTKATLKSKPEFPQLQELFKIGQWLRAKVLPHEDSKKKIHLTIEPKEVNDNLEKEDLITGNVLQCSVKSIEDHGIIFNTGKDEFTGFISNKELSSTPEIDMKLLKTGSVLLTNIVNKPSSRTITLRPISSPSNSKKTTISTISSIDAIQPGIMVDAIVSSITKNGLTVRVCGLVDGSINLSHLHEFELEKLEHKFTIGNSIKARVIGVLHRAGVKKLVLSVLPHILTLKPKEENASEAFPIGHVFDEVEVAGSDANYTFFKFGSNTLFGQIHNSKINTEEYNYNVGSKHEAKVLGYNEIDNLLVLTCDPKLVKAKYLKGSDIPIGTLINGIEIIKVLPESGGIIVKLMDDIEGFVPSNHISDIKLVYPERKFKDGSKTKGRVLNTNGKRVLISLKKSLVNIEDEQILDTYGKAEIGLRTSGTVEKFLPNGAVISFFGQVKAYLSKEEISETYVEKITDYLKMGQTVNVKVLDVDEEQQRMRVTLRQSSTVTPDQQQFIEQIQYGKTVGTAIVVEKRHEVVYFELESNQLKGMILDGHLSDGNYEQNRSLFKKLAVGSKLEVLMLEKDQRARTIVATAKKSLIEASKKGNLPSTFEDIQVNGDKPLYGFIKSVTNMGLFVSFANRLTGLVLAKYLKVDDLSKKYQKNQSVACHVIRTDEVQRRFLLTLQDDEQSEFLNQDKVINPIDSSKKTFGDFVPGSITKCVVKSVKGTQLNVQLGDNLQGRIDATQCFNDFDEIKNVKQPLTQFPKGTVLDVKVIGYHDAKDHKFLPITHRKSNRNLILELSRLEKELSTKDVPYAGLDISDIKEGQEIMTFIHNITKGQIFTSITPNITGKIAAVDITDDIEVFKSIEKAFPIGTAVKATVKEVDEDSNNLVLRVRKTQIKSTEELTIGTSYPARIFKLLDNIALVELDDRVIASAFITDALEDYSKRLSQVFHVNDLVVATVIDIDSNGKVAVSLRSQDSDSGDKVINSYQDLNRGDVVKGYVKSLNNNGVYVSLGRSTFALVRVANIYDNFNKDWKKSFKLYQPVVGKIAACHGEGKILMTLKESEVNGELKYSKVISDIKVDEIYEGTVRKVAEFGVFVGLDGTLNVSGLCHRSQISDNDVSNISSLFSEGDRVKVKILAVDLEKKQLSLGMKASYFTDDMEIDQNQDSEEESEQEDSEAEDEDEIMEDAAESDSESGSESESDSDSTSKQADGLSGLSTNGFDWTASILDQAEDDESSSDEEDFTQERKKKKKKSAAQVEDKTADLSTRAPQSTSDFERLLVGNPNSSVMWMNYMSFQLQLSEVEKAREIGERALKTINYREEQEKMNIWIAMLNLENTFGSEETLDEIFKRSCQYMDPLVMHQKLVGIYNMSENFEKAEALYKVMTKKFGKQVSVWVQYGSSLMDRGLNQEAHEVLARALQILPKREHIEVVKKYAQLEFSKGDAEQARSLFEGLVSDAPKRIDLWNIYLDQEIKQDSKKRVEDLFERVLTKKLSKKQAKFFFSKWLVFEEEKGDEQMVAKVKAKATEYVQAN